MFTNLFANPLEACPDPVRVTVTCRKAELGGRPALRVSVRDNGPGFAEEQRARAFAPFQTTKPTGTGLGMAITERFVEAHGARVASAVDPVPRWSSSCPGTGRKTCRFDPWLNGARLVLAS